MILLQVLLTVGPALLVSMLVLALMCWCGKVINDNKGKTAIFVIIIVWFCFKWATAIGITLCVTIISAIPVMLSFGRLAQVRELEEEN
jgi:hypothetical protein